MTILDQIVAHKQTVVQRQKKAVPQEKLLKLLDKSLPQPRFAKKISSGNTHLIAEIKRASPSAGVIRKDFHYLEIARAFEEAGASCLSVLTENKFFGGRLSYFEEIRDEVSVPLLRKDFVIDAYQIYESKLHRADAILLIASLLDRPTLEDFLRISGKFRLDTLVEVHDERECDRALSAGAKLVGINTRDLKDFRVDREIAARLLKKIPANVTTVFESGIRSLEDLRFAKGLGVNAVLVGEALMRARDPGREARMFIDMLNL